jgi:hypothetical protein
MPYLGDYIGHLLSEITIARMQADLEAVRVAELYASHPLLRNMPVPHFRLPEVDLDVPVVVKQVEEPRAGESPRGGVSIAEIRKAFEQVLTRQLEKDGIELTPVNARKVKAAIDARVAVLSQPTEIAVDVNRIADDFSSTFTQTIGDLGPKGQVIESARIPKLEAELKAAARLESLKLRKPPPRLNVLVTTKEIREAGPSEAMTRIRLKISEQAFEWTTIESESGSQDRLVPE